MKGVEFSTVTRATFIHGGDGADGITFNREVDSLN